MGKGLFISLPLGREEAKNFHARLAVKAAKLGFYTTRGPMAGRGHVGMVLKAWADGDLAILRLDPAEREIAIQELRRLSHRDGTGILSKLADELAKN